MNSVNNEITRNNTEKKLAYPPTRSISENAVLLSGRLLTANPSAARMPITLTPKTYFAEFFISAFTSIAISDVAQSARIGEEPVISVGEKKSISDFLW